MLMCGLLARATSSREGKLELPVETGADPAVSKVVDFLVEQGWLQKDGGDRTWTVTPSGRFCFESLAYGDIVTFYEYGGADFLALFVANPESVLTKLRAVAEDSVHRTIAREYLVEELARSGYRLRRVINPQDAALVVEDATNRYLDVAQRRLIQHVLVPRSASAALLSRLDATASDSVVTGKAGGGKTACVVEVTAGLRARGQPVLAFRLDRIPSSVHTSTDLGGHLDLEESPVLVLAAAAEAAGQPGVLIVDQLDAVSAMSGRNSSAFDLVERLIEEARGVGASATIHTVVVCRSFDWKNDSRLRRLLPEDHDRIDVTEFGSDEVKTILTRAGFDPALFRARQLELLRLPQNLALFLEAGFDPSIAPAFQTATRLFDQYWENKRGTVDEIVGTDHWMSVMKTLCGDMDAAQRLSVPRERLDGIPPAYVRQLASEGVLTHDGHRYGFGHESFFDYCFARLFMVSYAAELDLQTGIGDALGKLGGAPRLNDAVVRLQLQVAPGDVAVPGGE